MQHCKFQILQSSYNSRGHLCKYLIQKCNTIIVEPNQIDPKRILVFSNPIVDGFEVLRKHPKLNYLYIDNGYIGNHLSKRPNYYRISYNCLQNSNIKKVPFSRLRTIQMDQSPWNKDGDHDLIVCPNPTSAVWKFCGTDYQSWKNSMLEKYPHAKIREKSGSRFPRFKTIFDDIRAARKVIVYHSMTAVEAMMLGKEVHVSGHSAIEKFSDKYNYNRDPVVDHISWSQFTRQEFDDGTAWKLTYEYQIKT